MMTALLLLASAQDMMLSTMDEGRWAQQCLASDDLSADPCVTYIMGVADALSVSGKYCPTGSVYTLQAVAAVRKYLRDHPERLGHHPYVTVSRAIMAAAPCRK